VIHAEQTEHGDTLRNDRLIAVAVKSLTHKSLNDVSDVGEDLASQIEHFFVSYNSAKGQTFTPIGRSGREQTQALVHAAVERATK
jgi:inorganic pyrophosphatase